MLKMRMCEYSVFSVTKKIRKRFSTGAEADENEYCVFHPQAILHSSLDAAILSLHLDCLPHLQLTLDQQKRQDHRTRNHIIYDQRFAFELR